MRSAKIVATLGPASSAPDMLRQLVEAGVDVVRLNMSHADHAAHARLIESVRRVSRRLGKPVGILLDLQGPKLRVGPLAGHQPISLSRHERVMIATRTIVGTEPCFSVVHLARVKGIRKGQHILLKDGMVELEVTKIVRRGYECRVVQEGQLTEHAGVNIPGMALQLPSLSKKDLDDLQFGLSHGVDFVALSFVRKAQDVSAVRAIVNAAGARVPIIAKIERPEAVEQVDAILQVADGLMVARGDLGVELSPQQVPIIQKMLIEKSNAAGKLVITATQMLESMLDHPRPTRAEASDVANAIFDGTDAVMLSEETAVGRFPVHAVRTMADIIIQAEASPYGRTNSLHTRRRVLDGGFGMAIAHAACDAAMEAHAEAIMVFTTTGSSVRVIAKRRPHVPIFALAHSESIAHQLSLLWGTSPLAFLPSRTTDEMILKGEELLMRRKLLKRGATVIVVAGEVPLRGATNMMKIHRLGSSIIRRILA